MLHLHLVTTAAYSDGVGERKGFEGGWRFGSAAQFKLILSCFGKGDRGSDNAFIAIDIHCFQRWLQQRRCFALFVGDRINL